MPVFETDPVTDVINTIHHDTWQVVLLAAIEVITAFVLASLARKAIRKMNRKPAYRGIVTFSASMASLMIRIIGIIIALDQLGVSMSIIIGAISGLGVGAALALKSNMSSIVSGIQILFTHPFNVGDYIRVGKHEGTVTSIEITYTVLRKPDGSTVIIPNHKMISRLVTNYSEKPLKKMTISVLAGRDGLEEFRKKLLACAEYCSLVVKNPAPEARITSLKLEEAAVDLVFYASRKEAWSAYDQLMKQISTMPETLPQKAENQSSE